MIQPSQFWWWQPASVRNPCVMMAWIQNGKYTGLQTKQLCHIVSLYTSALYISSLHFEKHVKRTCTLKNT